MPRCVDLESFKITMSLRGNVSEGDENVYGFMFILKVLLFCIIGVSI